MPNVTAALNALKTKMLAALRPVEGVEGSIFNALREGEKAPSGHLKLMRSPDMQKEVYPVYHGATSLSDTPLRPLSEAHNDVTSFFGERRDPRALAYATVDPQVASTHAYGFSGFGDRPNLRAYVGRDLPQLGMGSFMNFDITPAFKNLSRADRDELFSKYFGTQKPWGFREANDRELNSALRRGTQVLPELGYGDLAAEIEKLRSAHLDTLPKNYIQVMTDLAGFKRNGAPIQKVMPQVMLTDPDEALRLEQLIPLKGGYARGGLVQAQECMCHG